MLALDAQLAGSKRKMNGVFASTNPRHPTKLSTKDNLKLRWIERITSSHLPSANFIFEITFPDADAMKFEAVPRSISYSEESDDFMECYCVNQVFPFFSNVIYPGDILLRVNGQSLLRKSVNGEFIDPQKSSSCFENIAAAATAAANAQPSSGVTMRFMRTGSTALNFAPSPAEMNLFQVDKHIAAKFTVLREPAQPSAKPSGPSSEQEQRWSIQLSFLDPQLPSGISQMMLGGAVTWGHSLLLPHSAPAAAAQCTQVGLLGAAPTGSSHGVAGPGAFLGPTGTPASLSDSWVAPAASLYADAPSSPASKTCEFTVARAVGALLAAGPGGSPSDRRSTRAKQADKAEAVRGGEVQEVGVRVYQLDASTFTGTATASGGLAAGLGLGGSGSLALGLLNPQFAAGAGGGTSRQQPRFLAVLQVTLPASKAESEGTGSGCAMVQEFALGRFEKEQEARLACDQALLEVKSGGRFQPKRFARRLATALASAQTAPVTGAAGATGVGAVGGQGQRPMGALSYGQGQGAGLGPAGTGTGGGQQRAPVPPPPYPAAGHPAWANRGAPGQASGYGAVSATGPLGQLRPGAAGSASTGSLPHTGLAGSSGKVISVGEASCGFGQVAKVMVSLAPSGSGGTGLHASGSSGNVMGLHSSAPGATLRK